MTTPQLEAPASTSTPPTRRRVTPTEIHPSVMEPLPGRDLPCSLPPRGERYVQLRLPFCDAKASDDSGSSQPPRRASDGAPAPDGGAPHQPVDGRDEPGERPAPEVDGP